MSKETNAPVLRAMAKNYAFGHLWDHLDGQTVTAAADEIDRLAAENTRLHDLLHAANCRAGDYADQRDAAMTDAERYRNIRANRYLGGLRSASDEGYRLRMDDTIDAILKEGNVHD